MNVDLLTTLRRRSTAPGAFVRPLQYLFLAFFLVAAIPVRAIELRLGSVYPLLLTDVDQHQLSTSDGHVTIITVVTRKDEEKAQMVGDRVPHVYLGDPKYRLITVVNFQQKIFPAFRGILLAVIRHRLDAEAKELQKTYSAKHLSRNPRSDIFVVADFDGKSVSQLGIAATSADFAVFVFDGRGQLVRRWDDVPSADALASALNAAR
jgi:hypothetical protein